MKQYLDLLRHVRENGRYKGDRTGTGTYSVFGYQMRFDLSDGKFPLVTTKKCHPRSIIHELLWFLRGETNIRYLKENGVSIWDEWSLKEEEFGGDVVGREMVYVEPRIFENSGRYDPVTDSHDNEELNRLLKPTWRGMLSRCYDKASHNYRHYGARGVFVCDRWQTYSNFVEDVQKLPNWKNKLANWDNFNLDKDYYSSNCYSPETCLWLSELENSLYSGASTLIAISPQGHAELYPSINEAARQLNIARNTLHRFSSKMPDILKGRNKSFKDWQFVIIEEPFRYDFQKVGDLGPVYGAQWRNWGGGKIYPNQVTEIIESNRDNPSELCSKLSDLFKNRGNNGIDQIKNTINLLKKNPDSRRILVSAWNPAQVDEMALPPCHALFQFYSEEMSLEERAAWLKASGSDKIFVSGPYGTDDQELSNKWHHEFFDNHGVPRRQLSCQLYQRKLNCALAA